MSRARDFADLAGSADAGGITGRNMLINGAMQVNQRGDQTTSTTTNNYFVDRFNVYIQATAVASLTQSTDVPSGQGQRLMLQRQTHPLRQATKRIFGKYWKDKICNICATAHLAQRS